MPLPILAPSPSEVVRGWNMRIAHLRRAAVRRDIHHRLDQPMGRKAFAFADRHNGVAMRDAIRPDIVTAERHLLDALLGEDGAQLGKLGIIQIFTVSVGDIHDPVIGGGKRKPPAGFDNARPMRRRTVSRVWRRSQAAAGPLRRSSRRPDKPPACPSRDWAGRLESNCRRHRRRARVLSGACAASGAGSTMRFLPQPW